MRCDPQVLKDPVTWLYPEIAPRRVGMLPVSPLHTLYWEESGNPEGKPVVALHGGPGGWSEARMRRFFDPRRYRIVVFDQRGCGKSTPAVELRDNTTPALVADLERLRAHLGIERWQVFGGSWGSTLALAYAVAHPDRVSDLVLRGVFLGTAAETAWANGGGVGPMAPATFAAYRAFLPADERDDLCAAYTRRVLDPDPAIHIPAARAWAIWESSLCGFPALEGADEPMTDDQMVSIARIEAHYFANGCFLAQPLLEQVARVRSIPAVLVHGRYDLVCPLATAWELSRAWPELDLVVVPDGGHVATPPMSRALVAATDRFSARAG